jgi:hypothetical protein
MSDHLKYFTEHLPATFVYAGINVERCGLFTGVRGKQIAGRCVLINTGPFACQQDGRRWWRPWRRRCGCTTTSPAPCRSSGSICTSGPAG